jgi:hypothetical protein
MKPLVCVGFAEALSAPEVVWSLSDAGWEVFAFARRGRRSALRHSSRVSISEITPPELSVDAAVNDLQRWLAAKTSGARRKVFFPLDDASLWLGNRLKLSDGWTVAGARGTQTELALDKALQILAAQAAGLSVPATTIAVTAADVSARCCDLPLMLRPANAALLQHGRLRKGRNWVCASPEELDRTISEWQEAWPLLVQPFIQGTGEGVFGMATVDGIQAWSAHRRLRMMNPHGSGSSACVSQPVPEEVKPAVERLIRHIGWRGLFMVELLRDRAGKLWFVEFNGRSWGSMALSRRQGFEYPAWAVNETLNADDATGSSVGGQRRVICRNAGREFMHLLFVLRGPKSKAFREWPSIWRTLRDVMWMRPGESFYNWRRDDWRVFVHDGWYTVLDNFNKAKS